MQRNIHEWIDTVAAFCGTALFLLGNIVFYAIWLLLNTITPYQFDKYPFSAMTTVLSIEAILLTVFVLISQNRQMERDKAHDREERARQDRLLKENTEINVTEEAQEKDILQILSSQNEALEELKQLVQVGKRTRRGMGNSSTNPC